QRGRFAGRETALFSELANAYVNHGRGELEAFAGLHRGGARADIVALRANECDAAEGQFPRVFAELIADELDLLVLQLVGPSVRDFFASESGCQVLETLGGGHEIVRVRVLDGSPSDDPAELITRTLDQREAFIAALESGGQLPDPSSQQRQFGGARTFGPLPENPDAMLPIIRRFKLEEPRPGRRASVEVEDYPLSHASTHSGAKLEP